MEQSPRRSHRRFTGKGVRLAGEEQRSLSDKKRRGGFVDMGYALGYNKRPSAPTEREVRTMRSSHLEETWERYKKWGDQKARDFLITRFAYLVKITAGRVVTSLPPNVDRDDLISAGVIGLIKAIDQFDRERKVKFETYAIALIRGAILEMLREEDWVPRSVRERVKLLERTYLRMEGVLGRPATEEEVAAELEVDLDVLHHMLAEAGRAALLSLDDIVMTSEGNEKIHLSDVVQDAKANTVAEVEVKSVKSTLGDSIGRLPEREQLVISLYYYEGLTFKEIGKILSVSESRVYQLHTQAVIRMRGYLQRDFALFRG